MKRKKLTKLSAQAELHNKTSLLVSSLSLPHAVSTRLRWPNNCCLLWSQETLDKILANKSIKYSTAQALAFVIYQSIKLKSWLKQYTGALMNDAQREVTDILQTVKELLKYAEDIVSTMMYTTLQEGSIMSTTADHAASHIGKASNVLLLLKSQTATPCKLQPPLSLYNSEVAAQHGLLVKQGG